MCAVQMLRCSDISAVQSRSGAVHVLAVNLGSGSVNMLSSTLQQCEGHICDMCG